ncbi:SMP-30/gluconolactonase/LRE family protein [Lentzea sp. HUAS12]|uniref:SMP-30/gluconolactonase/LRE family protein n=1 Tax=Lentzea sp. HUAS12 TaxID=2951806 RepID=UPI00209D9D81|nr:superoxide dismutase [Lentzea sp. HUAS12]USX48330.1 superoxide dismutase [Lentzea sp. HUAS12]
MTTIALPDGFRPESMTIGPGPFAYFGSLADGSIYRADLITGEGRLIHPGPGTASAGVKLDRRGRLFIAGGFAGDAHVIHAASGATLASYPLAGLVNDFALTPTAAWATDSVIPVLWKLPLGGNGELPEPDQVSQLALSGDIEYLEEGFNANGICQTPDGTALLVNQSNTGGLFHVDTTTGRATSVDLGGEDLMDCDGMVLDGDLLYVAMGVRNEVALLRLNHEGTVGKVLRRVSDPRFDIPSSLALHDDLLYVINGRFTTEATPQTSYTSVAIPRPKP